MWYRRALAVALIPAAFVLPTVVLLGRGLLFRDTGWDFVVYLVVAPILAVALGIVAALVRWRGSVRRSRAVSALDALVLSVWYAAIVLHAAMPDPVLANVFAAVGLVAGVVAFWTSITQLVTETRRRMREVIDTFEAQAHQRDGYDPRRGPGPVIRLDPPEQRRPE